jgi:membrane protease YdiL (CAAX protease family)
VPRAPTAASVLPRAALFLIIGYSSLTVLAKLLYSVFGLLTASVAGVFAGAALANALTIRVYERLRLADIGLHWNAASARSLLLGTAGGIAGGLAAVLLPALAGLATWQPTTDASSSPAGFVFLTAMLLFGAVGEEMLFRGYGLQVLVPVLGPMAAILPMSVLFAAAHADNQSVSWLALFNTFLWGVLLAAALLRSGTLWMPIGLHFGWNWILPVLGVNVSGFTMRLTAHKLEWNVAPVWSGGEYGPEGGLFCTLAVALLGAVLLRIELPRQELALVTAQPPAPAASQEETA